MKVFDVHGEFFDAGKDIPTQTSSSTPLPPLDHATVRVTREIIDLRIKYGNNQPELYKHLEARPDTDLQKFRDQVHNTHMESTRQYSQTAYRFGDYVMKFCLVPNPETQRKLYEETVKPEHGPDILHRWPQNFHKNHDGEVRRRLYSTCIVLADHVPVSLPSPTLRISKISPSSTPEKLGTQRSIPGRPLHAFTFLNRTHSTMR
jgi:hypothetical protein